MREEDSVLENNFQGTWKEDLPLCSSASLELQRCSVFKVTVVQSPHIIISTECAMGPIASKYRVRTGNVHM